MNNSIKGVWKLISNKPFKNEMPIESIENEWEMVKIITDKHFMFTEQAKGRKKFTTAESDNELLEAARSFYGGFGTYTYDEEKGEYIEHIKIFLNPNFTDCKIKYKISFNNNRLIAEGFFPAHTIGCQEKDMEIYEIWERIE